MKQVKTWLTVGVAVMLQSACGESAQPSSNEVDNAADAQIQSSQVEIALVDQLDGATDRYCIDIAGGNKNVDITKGLQSHTCYSYQGQLGTDQIFDLAKVAEGLLFMPNFDVCLTFSNLEAGASVGLSECADTDLQRLTFSGEGAIQPKMAPQLCVTAGKESRYGRSKKHQIRGLSLEPCSAEQAPYQTWQARTGS